MRDKPERDGVHLHDAGNAGGAKQKRRTSYLVSFPDPAFTLDNTSPEILGLLTQHYQKSGKPIRLLMLADHVVRIALPKRTLESCN